MKKGHIIIVLIVMIYLSPITILNTGTDPAVNDRTGVQLLDNSEISSAEGFATTDIITQMTRELTGLSFGVYNSYLDLSHHAQIDFSVYQISGWNLTSIELQATSMTAAPERKTMGITPGTNVYITIWNDTVHGDCYDGLYQAFYGLPHDGKLTNYSLTYRSDYYDVSNGRAYLGIRSTYYDKSSNVTGWISPWVQNPNVKQRITHDCSADNAILNASTYYYVVIDGTAMVGLPGTGLFNMVWWSASNTVTGLDTAYHLHGEPLTTWYSYVGADRHEAELNYTYIPWNTTSNSAIVYKSAEEVSLLGNSSSLSGTTWTFTDLNNISAVNFQSNISLDIGYDLVLHYVKHDLVSANWRIAVSGADPEWNVTMPLEYPMVSGTISRFLNVSIQPDWTPVGLYNNTSTNYGHFTKIGSVVYCTDMTNGSWTLTNTGDNYVTSIELSNSLDATPIQDKVGILIDVDIEISVEDGLGTPMNSGSTNLTIWYDVSVIHAPPDVPVSGGLANYLWDIDSISDNNGTHTIEVYWTNGLQAGYLVKQIFVYYPTTLVADDYQIEAFTDNNFNIGIDFTQDYPSRGLDSPIADLTYSFGSAINASMTNIGGGRWTAVVDTSSMSSGFYTLTVYGTGYALENRSIGIMVHLTYETLALNGSWSPSNSITYLESTNLTISYRDLSGTNIPDAWVNVTFESHTFNLTWDAIREVYWIELHGANFTAIPGTIPLNVSAWKSGYAPQYNNTLTIDIANEPGVNFFVTWNPDVNMTIDITYIEQLTIYVTYSYNSMPISGAWVRVTFVGYPTVNMTFNPLMDRWEVVLNGSDYLGTTQITVRATSSGYSPAQETQTLNVIEDTPMLSDSWTSSSATTNYATGVSLTITVEDSVGTSIDDGVLIITINGAETTYLAGEYSVTISPPQTVGIYQVNVTMVRYGYKTTAIFLTLTVRATSELSISTLSHEYEQWNLTVTVTYTDTLHSTPITGATVVMTLDGVDYTLNYSGGSYVIEIVLNIAPGTYTLSVTASAALADPASDSEQLIVDAKRAVYLQVVSEGDPNVAGQLLSFTATLSYNDTIIDPVIGVNVYFVVSIRFVNGSVQVLDNPSQYDSTNTDGEASWAFPVPSGAIEYLNVTAYYFGSRTLWSTQTTLRVVVATNPIIGLLNFFFLHPIGQLVLGSMAVLGIVTAAYNRRVKPKKRAAKLSLESQLEMFIELGSLRHFMAVYLDRGTCVFYHPFTDERIQPDLISGFIAAITSVYGEIKGDGVRGTLEEIQYHGLRLNSYSGDKIIGILILEGEITPFLKDRLQFFVELFENQYERDLEGWSGLIDCFDTEWIVSTLNSAFNYSWLLPHKFGPTQKVTKTEARILDYIAAVRDERTEFYIRKLLSPLSEMLDMSEAEVLERLLTLHEKGAIVPVSVQTVLQRQGMGLSNGQEAEEIVDMDSIESQEEPETLEYEEPAEEVEEPIEPKEEPVEEPAPEPEKEIDPLDAFVQDVESLLSSKKDEDTEPENE